MQINDATFSKDMDEIDLLEPRLMNGLVTFEDTRIKGFTVQ